jgi:hypothetical protein
MAKDNVGTPGLGLGDRFSGPLQGAAHPGRFKKKA